MRALGIVWRIAWGIALGTTQLAIVFYVLDAIKDRQTGLIIGVLGLIYATIRLQFWTQAHSFTRLANGLVQMLYGLQQLLDQQQEIPEIRPAPKLDMGGFYLEAGIAVVFLGLVYLICLLYVLGHVNSSLRSIWPGT